MWKIDGEGKLMKLEIFQVFHCVRTGYKKNVTTN